MQIHQLKRSHAQKHARRIGRGGKRGTYSGRGIKGLGARAGGKFRPEERDIIKKIPKLRGYRFSPFQVKPAIVNLDTIERYFAAGDTVSPASLVAKGLVVRVAGRAPKIKILSRGGTGKKFIFKEVIFSAAAFEKNKSSNAQVPITNKVPSPND